MNYLAEYASFLSKSADLKTKIRVVFDASDGTAGLVLNELLPQIPQIEGVIINGEPNGDFPAHGPNPLGEGALVDLRRVIIQKEADLGAIFDGDADRVLFLDEQGALLDSFETFRLIKDRFEGPFVVDVRALARFSMPDIPVVESKAGRLFIWEAMRRAEAALGVERTGHFFFKEYRYFDSAILASIHLMNVVSELKTKGQRVFEAVKKMPKLEYPPEINFKVTNPVECIAKVKAKFSGGDYELFELDGVSVYGKDFAFNLRLSSTEPLVRLNLAARKKDTLEQKLAEIKEVLEVK
ncbi:MAG: hypothetical protein Q8P99_03015 [bacterium]|nr:hypothetical protein [bacterium]MDZ4231564.1 hypothetical protein [Patescibacteria group bacterium]